MTRRLAYPLKVSINNCRTTSKNCRMERSRIFPYCLSQRSMAKHQVHMDLALEFLRNEICLTNLQMATSHHWLWDHLWNIVRYYYKVGHRMKNGGYVWGLKYYFTSSPALGEDTVQRVVIFGMRLDLAFFLKSYDPCAADFLRLIPSKYWSTYCQCNLLCRWHGKGMTFLGY